MKNSGIPLIAIILLLNLFSGIVCPAAGDGGIPGPGSGEEGIKRTVHHTSVTIDKIIDAIESAQVQNPDKYEEFQSLLQPVSPQTKYIRPTVLMYYNHTADNYTKDFTVSRNQHLDIGTVVTNNNELDLRRTISLYLEVMDPGCNVYRQFNSWPQKIQPDGYSEKSNTTIQTWDIFPSFSYLNRTGESRIRASVSDGVKRTNPWTTESYSNATPPYYTTLIFNVTNVPPTMSNITLSPSRPVVYNDPLEYKANIEDADGDSLNVILHILDEQHNELDPPRNKSLPAKSKDLISVKASENGLFSKEDVGKNFTYFYSFDDGINCSRTDFQDGPHIRKGPELYIEDLKHRAQSESYYWWQWYTFSVKAKNLNSEEDNVTFVLWTKTGDDNWIVRDVLPPQIIGPNPKAILFDKIHPFGAADANQTFSYRITYDEYDQNTKKSIEATGPRLNAKVVKYSILDWIVLANLLPILFLVVVGSMLIERKKKRGIESQERSEEKSGIKDNKRGYTKGNFMGKCITNKISEFQGGNK